MLVPWKPTKGISGDLRHVLVVFWLEGAPNAPTPWSPIDNLVFHENLRYKIVLGDDLTMGKQGVIPIEGRQRNFYI